MTTEVSRSVDGRPDWAREERPLPPEADLETLAVGVYASGTRRLGPFYQPKTLEVVEEVLMEAKVAIAPRGTLMPWEGTYDHADFPVAYERKDGCRVIQFWSLVEVSRD